MKNKYGIVFKLTDGVEFSVFEYDTEEEAMEQLEDIHRVLAEPDTTFIKADTLVVHKLNIVWINMEITNGVTINDCNNTCDRLS